MYDPKFEKGVRQKMEGLEFVPSESVWANIEKAVADRHRRRGGFFFRFTLPGMLLAGAVALLYHVATPVHRSPEKKPALSPVAASPAGVTNDHSGTSERPAASLATRATPAGGSATIASPSPAAGATHSRVAGNRSGQQLRLSGREQELPATAPSGTGRGTGEANEQGTAAAANQKSTAGIVRGARDATGQGAAVATGQGSTAGANQGYTAAIDQGTGEATGQGSTTAAVAGPKAATAGNAGLAPYLFSPALVGQGSAGAVGAAKLSAKTNTIDLAGLEKKKRPWEAGFVAGGGLSRLNRLNVSSDALSTGLFNISSQAAASSKHYVSDVRADFSFLAGIYLQKPLSGRWAFNLGMNLHYYSTRITIGQPINTYVPVTVSLIAPTVTPSAQNTTAYIAGDREVFTNHYYFLELPVNLRYTVIKNRLLPVFLEGGFVLSRLMGSNALFYDAHTGVYYKDPSVLQKTQFNVSSAFMAGLPFHGIRVEAGPQVQYGLTPLINNHSQGDQHFFYAGLRVVILPGRK
jgi:hypothetical protein